MAAERNFGRIESLNTQAYIPYAGLEEVISWVNLSTMSAQAACLVSQSDYNIANLNSILNYEDGKK